jgi:aminopeptidase N
MRADQTEPVRLADNRPSDNLVDRVELDIALHPTATRVVATLQLRPNPAGRAGAPLVLDGDGLVPVSVQLDNVVLDLASGLATPDALTVDKPPARPFTLKVETLLDPTGNTHLMGLYRTGSAYCTQCEAEGFRRITYMIDRPDVMAVYTTRIEALESEAPVLLGNGNPVSAGRIEGTGRHFAVWHDPFPKPCYLFALVAGNLEAIHDSFTTSEGRTVALGIYVEPGKGPLATYAMDALKRSMRWDEEAFGRAYDLDVFNIVAVSDYNMGAMENKGLNVFNDKYILASPGTATDTDYAGIETVEAHEYFHNWTGNRITCRDRFQLCLKEGLTVFRDQEFSADQRSRAVKRIADVRTLRARQFPEDAGPLAHSVRPLVYKEINNFYTATIYEKGAEIIRMLKRLIGAPAFEAGMTLYFDRYDGTAATIEQFVSCFAQASGRDLGAFMRWYEQAGTPEVKVRCTRDEAEGTMVLDLGQETRPTPGQPDKQPLVMPVAFGLVNASGGPVPLGSVVTDDLTPEEIATETIVLSSAQRRIAFRGLPGRCTPSLFRGFSAPVRVLSDLTNEDRLTLLAHDPDGFNRWEAAQVAVSRLLIGRVKGEPEEAGAEESLVGALGLAMVGALVDPAFAAQVLAIPTEADIARDIGADVDPDAVHQAREALRRSMGTGLSASLAALYTSLSEPRPYSPDAESAGRRALRSTALAFLAAGDPAAGDRRCMLQFEQADNMTDRLGALGVLCSLPLEGREAALQRFYDLFKDQPLVLDKWFAVQAGIPEADTLDRVHRLMLHPTFSLANPNRVYALIGAFSANPTQFNRADGAGYDFLAEVVLGLDGKNPQVAARLLNAFRSWRMMDAARRMRAETALRRVQAQPSLSPDVRDIAERCLA